MKTSTSYPSASLYKGFRFSPEIISHAVWLSFRFSLSLRDVNEVFLTSRGKRHSLWRAVDQDGNVLDILVTTSREETEPGASHVRKEKGKSPTCGYDFP